MKKILILGILTLSALSFAADTTTTAPANATPANASMPMNQGGMMNSCCTPEMMKMMKDGKCPMMTPEMMKMMKDKGMMNGGTMNHDTMNHGAPAPASTTTPAKQ